MRLCLAHVIYFLNIALDFLMLHGKLTVMERNVLQQHIKTESTIKYT